MNLSTYLTIDRNSPTTIRQQIRQQIAWLIANGVIKVGDKLPSIHVLSEELGVNLHTIRQAYLQLESDGLLETKRGRGTHIVPFDFSNLLGVAGNVRSHTIGVLVPSWSNPFYHNMMDGVESVTVADQTLFFLCMWHEDPIVAWREIARLIAKGVDGLLIVSFDIDSVIDPQKDHERLAGIPFVCVDAPGAGGYAVQIDLASAGYQATQHLLEQGHKRIGLITYFEETHNVTPVNQGYLQAMHETGMSVETSLICRVSGFGFSAGEEGMRDLLGLSDPPSAVFAITDLMALGAVKVIKEAGLNVPEDISIVGFNNIPMTELVDPPLTTVSAPSEALGQEAMKMLAKLIDGSTPPQREVLLPTSLIIRGSTRKL